MNSELIRKLVVWLIGEPRLPHVWIKELPIGYCGICKRRMDDPSILDRHRYCYGPPQWGDYLWRLRKPL